MRVPRAAVAAALAVGLSAGDAGAQKGSARIFGTVVDKATQGQVAGARIVHLGDGRVVIADSMGFFQFNELKAGIVRFRVAAPNFPITTFAVALANGEGLERDIELDSTLAAATDTSRRAQNLPTVEVEAEPSLGLRFRDFERRKATGRGQYITRTQIETSGANSLQEAVRGLRGVQVACGSGTQCRIAMARSPGCAPNYIVDEREDNFFGPNIAVRDIEALEVYTGASDVPGEFAGTNAGCGVIVIWTKSGPPRTRR